MLCRARNAGWAAWSVWTPAAQKYDAGGVPPASSWSGFGMIALPELSALVAQVLHVVFAATQLVGGLRRRHAAGQRFHDAPPRRGLALHPIGEVQPGSH